MKLSRTFENPVLRLMICIAMLAVFMTIGCVAKGPQHSGFLGDYSKMQTDPMDKKSALYWKDPAISFGSYSKVIIDPVSVYISSDEMEEKLKNIDADAVNKMTTYFRDAFVKAMAQKYTIVDEVGQGVARIRLALTSIEVDRKALKAYQYVPVALVLTTVTEVTGVRNSLAILNMEGEATDSLTGHRIAAIVQTNANEISVKKPEELTDMEVYPTLDYWANKIVERLAKEE